MPFHPAITLLDGLLIMYRVWKGNEDVAERLRNEKPIETVWDGRKFSRWNNPLPVMIKGNKNRIRAKDYV